MTPGGRLIARLAAAAPLPLLSILVTASAPEAGAVQRYMSAVFELSPAEFARVNAGEVVARGLPVKDSREIGTLGVVRMKITPEFYVERLRNIASFKNDEAILQIGVFSQPPDLQDVRNLTLDESDLRGLSACKVGDCGVQLSAEAINRFRHEVPWRQPDAYQRANELVRQILVGYVADYQRLGPDASMRYADQSRAVDLKAEFASLADAAPGLWTHFPALRQHLFEYPGAKAAGTTDIVYWSKEKMGRRPVVSVTHLAIVPASGGDSPADFAVASRHLYGTHYLDASLGLTILLRDRSASSPVTYLVYMNRSRVDVFGGIFGGMIRKIVSSRARGTVADHLATLQHRLEAQFATLQTS